MSLREDLIDKRIVARNLHKGLVEEKGYARYIESLPDVSDKAEPLAPPGGEAANGQDANESS